MLCVSSKNALQESKIQTIELLEENNIPKMRAKSKHNKIVCVLVTRPVREVLLDAFRDEPGLEVVTSGLFGTAPVFVVGSVLLSSATLSKDMKANPFFSTAVSVEAFTVIS